MFVVNTDRTYLYPVTVTIINEDGTENVGKFTAKFKVLPREDDVAGNLLDYVLMGIDGIELKNGEGQTLEGTDKLTAAKKDPALSVALVAAYQDSIVKKNRGKSF